VFQLLKTHYRDTRPRWSRASPASGRSVQRGGEDRRRDGEPDKGHEPSSTRSVSHTTPTGGQLHPVGRRSSSCSWQHGGRVWHERERGTRTSRAIPTTRSRGKTCRLPAHPRGRARRPSTITSRRRGEEERPELTELFGTTTRTFVVSLLRLGIAGRRSPRMTSRSTSCRAATNSSWMVVYDQALKGKMEGVLLSGMTGDEHRSGQQSVLRRSRI